MGKIKKTQKEFEKEIFDLVQDEYTVLGEYKGVDTKILMRHNCEKCNNWEWKVRPSHFTNTGTRCPECARLNKIKDEQDFLNDVKAYKGDEFTFLEKYKGKDKKIKVRHNCELCNNHEFKVTPNNLFSEKYICPECYNKIHRFKSQEKFNEDIFNLVGNEYTFLEPYIDDKTKIKVRHNCELCNNHEYSVKPNNFISQGQRCPECNRLNQLKDFNELKQDVYNLVKNEYEIIGDYINYDTKIKFRHNCELCNNHEFEMTPTNFISNNQRCPECYKLDSRSNGCKLIEKVFNEKNINYKKEQPLPGCKFKQDLLFDYILIDINIYLEFDGIQHFDSRAFGKTEAEFKIQQMRDKAKNNYCITNNLTLIRIPYTSYKEIPELIDNILNLKFNNNSCMLIENGNIVNQPKIYKEMI